MVPRILYQFPDSAGQSFRPSNGTEGMIFEEHFCHCCIHEKWVHTQDDADMKCEIYSNMILFEIKEDGYPVELVFDSEGWPVCTNWKKWDWGSSNDPDGLNEPPEPPYEPQDPNQLMLFSVADDILETHKPEKIESKKNLQV